MIPTQEWPASPPYWSSVIDADAAVGLPFVICREVGTVAELAIPVQPAQSSSAITEPAKQAESLGCQALLGSSIDLTRLCGTELIFTFFAMELEPSTARPDSSGTGY